MRAFIHKTLPYPLRKTHQVLRCRYQVSSDKPKLINPLIVTITALCIDDERSQADSGQKYINQEPYQFELNKKIKCFKKRKIH